MLLNQESDILTVDDLCEVLRIGKNAAYKLINSGKIKCYRMNRVWKIPKVSVIDYIYCKQNIYKTHPPGGWCPWGDSFG